MKHVCRLITTSLQHLPLMRLPAFIGDALTGDLWGRVVHAVSCCRNVRILPRMRPSKFHAHSIETPVAIGNDMPMPELDVPERKIGAIGADQVARCILCGWGCKGRRRAFDDIFIVQCHIAWPDRLNGNGRRASKRGRGVQCDDNWRGHRHAAC